LFGNRSILRFLGQRLQKLVDKRMLHLGVVHHLLLQYFTYAELKPREEMAGNLKELLPTFLHTADGAHVGLHCVSLASAKARLTITKPYLLVVVYSFLLLKALVLTGVGAGAGS
jgi:pumilio homology domain family member 6